MQVFIQFCILIFVLSGGISTEQGNFNQNKSNHVTERSQIYEYVRASAGSNSSDIINKKKGEIPEVDLKSDDDRIANHPNLNLLPTACGEINGDRIVGGDIANMYQFPWMVIIAHNISGVTKLACGGSIINKRYVLTAAHCVKDKVIAYVLLGDYNWRTQPDVQNRLIENHLQNLTVETSVIHENYCYDTLVNDIALLRLSADVNNEPQNVDFICLPTTPELRHRVLDNVTATITGWGITEYNLYSDVLRVVNLPIHTNEQCTTTYKRFTKLVATNITGYHLCAGEKNKNICNGDSGGPLILKGKFSSCNRYVQYGITSHGNALCGAGIPALFTDVRKYMGWILDHIAP